MEYGMCDTTVGGSWLHSCCSCVWCPEGGQRSLQPGPEVREADGRPAEGADVAASPLPAQPSEGLEECYDSLLPPVHRWAKCRHQSPDLRQHVGPQIGLSRVEGLQCCVTSVFPGVRGQRYALTPEVFREGNSGKCSSSLAKLARNKARSQPH